MHQFYHNINEPIQSIQQTSKYRYFLLEKAQIGHVFNLQSNRMLRKQNNICPVHKILSESVQGLAKPKPHKLRKGCRPSANIYILYNNNFRACLSLTNCTNGSTCRGKYAIITNKLAQIQLARIQTISADSKPSSPLLHRFCSLDPPGETNHP